MVILPILFPKIAGAVFGILNFNPGIDYKYATYVAAAFMLGWVSLLVWADRQPVQRRGVLLLTIFPVVIGLIIAGVYAVTSNLIPVENMLPTWLMQGILALLFAFSYVNANKLRV